MSKPTVEPRIAVVNDDGWIICPGIAELLHGVVETGSLHAAAADMGMAYSKAWKLIQNAQRALRTPLLETFKGPHGSLLTGAGHQLLKSYDHALKRAQTVCDKEFSWLLDERN